jgi:hemerythrin-like domain-containing protein
MSEKRASRRNFISAGFAAIPVAASLALPSFGETGGKAAEPDVSPAEDLMREHGALSRILLIYDEARHRLDQGKDVDALVITQSAGFIRDFIESYHEKLEEKFLFPRFEKAKKLVDLVTVLRDQHSAGRILTAKIIEGAPAMKSRAPEMSQWLGAFTRMYRPHEAREDTILFPAFRELVSEHEYAELGEQFEDEEHKLFGKDGFERNIDKIAALEKQMGIYDLAQFTSQLK